MENFTALQSEEPIAEMLDVEPKTLQAWRHRGGGPPYIKVGRLVRYDPIAVRRWVEARTVRSTSEMARS
jgi:hypothetical protein